MPARSTCSSSSAPTRPATRCGCASTPASAMATAARPTPAARTASTASGMTTCRQRSPPRNATACGRWARTGDAPVDTAAYLQLWNATRRRLEARLGHAVRLEIEPGRYLVAEAGVLVSEVRAVKRMGGNSFALVDAGFNDLMRPALYGGHH